ncbi:MAG: histidinol dehydrogenase [Candidatus Bathyarchaeia archaeon]
MRSMRELSDIYPEVRAILEDIRNRGDEVTIEHYRKHKESITPSDLEASRKEIEDAYSTLKPDLVDALKKAAENIRRFHQAQLEREMWCIGVAHGILAGRITRPIEKVGAYVPGGKAAYPSSVLMNVLPARVAGVKEIFVCTPPGKGMTADPSILVASDIAGADRIFKIGGPWAIASLAYGTQSIPKVDKIVGPGNRYVTAAKMLAFGLVDIDSPAGPSEVLILADESGDPALIGWDMLSQLEHDEDAAAVLVTTSERLAHEVSAFFSHELESLPRKEIIRNALFKNSAILMAEEIREAIDFTNEYAPEHLQIITKDPWDTLSRINHAGSIFLGPYAPVPAGDYASGTNHVLPTGQCARMFSGLSVDDFIKKPTFQYITQEGLRGLRDTILTLAEAEGLPIHARSVKERFKSPSMPR